MDAMVRWPGGRRPETDGGSDGAAEIGWREANRQIRTFDRVLHPLEYGTYSYLIVW